MNILVTGVAGFIGMHTAMRLLKRGDRVYGIDNLNSYYDPRLKHDRLHELERFTGFRFLQVDIADGALVSRVFREHQIERVVHLAAQVGVRYSIDRPEAYVQSNLVGFVNLLEACRHSKVEHLVYASSSSVYGSNHKLPFAVGDPVDNPISLYAATKRSNELMAHVYSHLFGLSCTGLRFFTVYGPWGRPDMAVFSFTKAIIEGKPIRVFNRGEMKRDFTYVDDIVEGVIRVLGRPPAKSEDIPPYRLYNIGNHQPVSLFTFISVLERCIGKKAITSFDMLQPGDVQDTCADITDLARDTGFFPNTSIETGLERFVEWYRAYYNMPQITDADNPVADPDLHPYILITGKDER
jgi:UDP-glucuronate 4-epimerase